MEIKCQRCQAQGHPSYFGSEVRCAFPSSGPFKGEVTGDDNWQCATVGALRSLLYEADDEIMLIHGVTCVRSRRDDQSAALMHTEDTGWFFFTWYKNRGACMGIWDEYGKPIELSAAEKVLEVARKNGFVDEYYRQDAV